ncbi:MAG: LysR family transcriptional regulator [Rhizobiaceae bacterium]
MNQLNDLACFVAVAETLGFAPAARRLGASTAGVSKSVLRLEDRLKVRLFTRTTRRVALTEEGKTFYRRCRAILEDIAQAESEVLDTSQALQGRVRIDMPIVFGERHVVPVLAEFHALHPEIQLHIRLSDTFSDLIEEGIDLALRFGELDDRRFVAKQLGIQRLVTCASPAYLLAHGTPGSLEDLENHVCIALSFRSTGRVFNWRFASSAFHPPELIVVNDGAAYRRLALLGCGIVQDLEANVREELQNGWLIELFEPHSVAAFPLSIVWPGGRKQPHRVRALIDYLTTELSPRLKSGT